MATLPRGIAPELLLSQVKNTMPYLFDSEVNSRPLGDFYPGQVLRTFEAAPTEALSHFEYYRLCLSSHYLSCGTPVPTDVDNQIRLKLWPAKLPLETALEMAELVLKSRKWNFTLVSTRFTYGAKGTPWEHEALSGHLGEWFTVSCAAYCAMKQYKEPAAEKMRTRLFEAIADEVNRHSEIFGSLWRAKDGLNALKTAANIAHNFGDLDRVMDMWNLAFEDPLRLKFYKLTAQPFDADKNLRHLGRLWVAGELYKAKIAGGSLALENHRHFALRKPRCLREKPELVIPTAPFFDDWGNHVAVALANADGSPSEKTLEVFDALLQGWVRQPGTVAYGRGLTSLLNHHPELKSRVMDPVFGAGVTKEHLALLEIPREVFEARWASEALAEMDEIPSRA